METRAGSANRTGGRGKPARVLIVDDHPLLREGLTQLLGRHDDFAVCGQAAGISEAWTVLEQQSPDLMVLDLRLGGGDVLEFIKAVRARHDRLRILVLTQHDEPVYVERVLHAGAHGYVTKEDAPMEVLNAMRQVLQGGLYVSRSLAERMLGQQLVSRPVPPEARLKDLTDREFTIYQLLGQGLSSREIAGRLGLSVKTVETHRENIKRKRGLATTAELVQEATEWWRSRQLPLA